jgi:DNA primase
MLNFSTMEIAVIKQSLTLATILNHYGLKPNKNNMLLCPFHEDTKPSLQINLETNFYKCHACGKKGDQIQWVQDFGNLSKREAILKCVTMIDEVIISVPNIVKVDPSLKGEQAKQTATITEDKSIFLEKMFQSFRKGIFNSPPAKQYCEQRNLDLEKLNIGFNGGQFHHGTRRDETLINNCLAIGLLLDRNIISKTGEKAFNVFGNKSIVFPLKNKENQTVSLYFRSTINEKEAKHFYLKNRQGLYPNYPNPDTKKLILTESIIDCASLLQITEIAENYSLLACYGTNGLNEEIQNAIQELPELEEIIFCFDNDNAGNEAIKKYAEQFKQYKISTIELPNKDINETLQLHEPEIFIELLEKRKSFLLSAEIENVSFSIEDKTTKKPTEELPRTNSKPTKKDEIKIEVLGKIDTKDLSQLRVTIAVYNTQNDPSDSELAKQSFPSRQNINLYNDDQVEKSIRKIAEKTGLGTIVLRKALNELTEKLEKSRNENPDKTPTQTKNRHEVRTITQSEQEEALKQLKSPNLTKNLSQKLQQTGIIGEEKNALFLFCILLSHRMKRTLHAVVQGTSGSGKSHLITKIGDVMHDQNKIKRFTRVTDKSFYNYGEYDLKNTGIILEDYDGLSEEAEMAWRELQSSGKLSSSVSQKNENTGEILTGEKYVFGPIASLVATTKFRIYEDNESRVFVIAIDESEAQTERVLDYMAKKSAKTITNEQEEKIQREIQNKVYLLKGYLVQNTYRLELPKTVKHRRRLTQMLHDFIEQVTILHQYQRQKSNEETLITTVEDLEIAVDLMFNSIVIKSDELDGILRQFYEDLKQYVEKKSPNYEFTQREIRQAFRISKSQGQRYFNELEELEYIHKSNMGKRNSYHYQVSYWDNITKIRAEIRQHLQEQIDNYKPKNIE